MQVVATAARLMPGLPVTVLRSLRSATPDAIAAETRKSVDAIVDGLTAPAERLLDRFARHGPVAPAAASRSGVIDLDGTDPSAAFTEAMRDSLLGDGLPLSAPTPEQVDAFLAAAGATPDETVWPVIPPRSTPVSAREVAAVAVTAGAQPRWAPVVFAAYRAMAEPQFRLFQAAITTHPGGTLVFVSGPDAESYGFAAGRGALGPGFPANATTGRAVALGNSFLLGAIPGGADLTAQGSPAEYAYCAAENLAASPWPGLHVDAGHPDATTVTVLKCEGPHNMLDQQSTDPAMLLRTVRQRHGHAGLQRRVRRRWPDRPPAQPGARRPARRGRLGQDATCRVPLRQARNPREDLRGRGIGPIWPAWFDRAARVPVVPSPGDLVVTVTGGAGPASQVAIPWGYSRAVTRASGASSRFVTARDSPHGTAT